MVTRRSSCEDRSSCRGIIDQKPQCYPAHLGRYTMVDRARLPHSPLVALSEDNALSDDNALSEGITVIPSISSISVLVM